VNSPEAVATICLVVVGVVVNVFWGRTNADAREVVHAMAKVAKLNRTMFVIWLFLFLLEI